MNQKYINIAADGAILEFSRPSRLFLVYELSYAPCSFPSLAVLDSSVTHQELPSAQTKSTLPDKWDIVISGVCTTMIYIVLACLSSVVIMYTRTLTITITTALILLLLLLSEIYGVSYVAHLQYNCHQANALPLLVPGFWKIFLWVTMESGQS